MRTHRTLTLCALLLLSITTSGCFTKKAPPPTQLAAKIVTSQHLNPNADGAPSPLVVRLYELKSTAKFKNADFFSLFDNDTQALGADLLAKDEFRFNPGDSKALQRKLDPATRFIGVMAAYRDLEKSVWQTTAPIAEHQLNSYTILLGRNEISISVTQPEE